MSIGHLLTQTATVTRTSSAGTTDAGGNWVPGPSTTAEYPCRLERGHGGRQSRADTSETYEGAERMESAWLLFLPATADITGRDLVTVDDRKFEVDGEPTVLRTPRGAHHIEAILHSAE